MRLCLLLVAILFVTGCSTFNLRGSGRIPAGDDVAVDVPEVEIVEDDENQAVLDTASDNIKSFPDIPHEDDRKVEQWVNYFTGKGRKWMQIYLERSGRYLPLMKSILKEHGLPEDLVYLAMIESGFASSVRSHAGAVGYWQFITPTGRRYGLTINSLLDERRDPILATHAAAKYLKSLYNIFEDWYLAFAAYNGGENRVARSVVRYQTRNFFDLVENRRALHRETVNYVPKFLAARLIAENPANYGFENLGFQDPIQFEEIVAEKSVYLKKLSKDMGVDYEDIKLLNPQFTTAYAPKYSEKILTIRIPPKTKEQALVALAGSYIENQAFLAKLQSNNYGRVRVRRGDTLSTIARRFRTSMGRLKELNNMGRSTMIRAGRYIKVPLGHGFEKYSEVDGDAKVTVRLPKKNLRKISAERKISSANKAAHDSRIHVVRRGENLTRIAKRYRVTLQELLVANNLRNSSRINVGNRILIPE